MGIHFELQLSRDMNNTNLEGLIESSVDNRRKRCLYMQIEQVRNSLAHDFNEFGVVYVLDSVPLKICKNVCAS